MGKKYTTEFVRGEFEKYGVNLSHSFEYINVTTKIDFICPNGHESKMSYSQLKYDGLGCGQCAGNIKPTEKFIIDYFKKFGYTVLTPINYVNKRSKINFICSKGHRHNISWNDFKNGRNGGHRCGKCSFHYRQTGTTTKTKKSFFSNIYCRVRDKISLNKDEFYKWCDENIEKASIVKYFNCHNGYHLDHLIPCSFFDLSDLEQIKLCWCPLNLRYLPGLDNLSRGNKLSMKEYNSMDDDLKDIMDECAFLPDFWKHEYLLYL